MPSGIEYELADELPRIRRRGPRGGIWFDFAEEVRRANGRWLKVLGKKNGGEVSVSGLRGVAHRFNSATSHPLSSFHGEFEARTRDGDLYVRLAVAEEKAS